MLLFGVADIGASKRFYADRGLTVAKSYGGKYVEFEAAPVPSSWVSTGAARWRKTPTSRRTAVGLTGS